MKKSIVRVCVILILAAMALSVFAGCAEKADNKASQQVPASSAPKASDDKKPATVKVMYDFNVDPQGMPLSNNKYTEYIKQKTGVDVQIDSPGSANYVDKVNIVMASGNYPDAVMINDRNYVFQFASNGILADLAPYINDNAKYPNVKKFMPAEAFLPVTEGSKIWAFPYNRQDAINQVVYVRKDWMAKLNLKTPKTLDEFYQVMKAFTEKDPDGNGKNDTFGLLSNNSFSNGARMIFAAFDATNYKIIDGKVTSPEITTQYKDALKFLNKLIKEKIMDSEYTTTTTNIYMDKLKTGKYGMTSNFWHGDQFPEFKNDKKVHEVWDALDFPTKPDGTPSKLYYTTVNRHYILVPGKGKNIDALMRLFDWAVSPEGTRFAYLGVENEEYKMADGKVQVIKPPFITQWMFSLVKQGQLNDDVKSYMKTNYPEQAIARLELAVKNGVLDKIAAMLPYYPELSSFNLDKITQEFRDKAVLGNIDIDSSWDDYVKKWRTAGGDKAIQFWTDWYNKEGKNLIK